MGALADAAALAQELCGYSRLCYDRGLVGAAGGNLSARIPGRDSFLVTASGVALRDVRAESLVVVDSQGRLLEAAPGLRPSKETGFHLAVYRTRPSANAVVHVHPPYAILFSALGRQIPPATISARLKLRQGPVVEDADPGSAALSNAVARAVEESPGDVSVILLRNHGLVSFSANLRGAFDDAELASDTAKIAWLLEDRSPGTKRTVVDLDFGAGLLPVDLSTLLDESTPHYPSDPAYERSVFADHSTGSYLSTIKTGLHAGTHVDVPLHFLKGGAEVSSMPLDLFSGSAVAVDAPKAPGQDITTDDVARARARPGDIVLFRTGWEKRVRTGSFFEGEWPGFTPEAVRALVALGAKAIGGDIPSADSPAGIASGAPAHRAALEAGMPIYEILVNLGQVVGRRFFFIGLPLKILGGEASPVRAVAMIEP